MDRRKFLGMAGAALVVAGTSAYLLSDKRNIIRADIKEKDNPSFPLKDDEREILRLASLAPSGHNTQPWRIRYMEPYHWIVANDPAKWLPAVDPMQRETILSIGAFIQNLEYAAACAGYSCAFTLLARDNRSREVMEVRLKKINNRSSFDTGKIEKRRTVRSGYLETPIKKEDIKYLADGEQENFQFFSNQSPEYRWLNEQTIEANRLQTYRDDAQSELADWMRLSSGSAKKHCDGLTTASMELKGIPAWMVRNFYGKKDIMGKKFREQGLDKVKQQVSRSGGWLLITSKDHATATLLETGKRLQRILLKIRERHIAIHPMTQILEEETCKQAFYQSFGMKDEVQFILRTGYINHYPEPVSLRRPVEKFVTFNPR